MGNPNSLGGLQRCGLHEVTSKYRARISGDKSHSRLAPYVTESKTLRARTKSQDLDLLMGLHLFFPRWDVRFGDNLGGLGNFFGRVPGFVLLLWDNVFNLVPKQEGSLQYSLVPDGCMRIVKSATHRVSLSHPDADRACFNGTSRDFPGFLGLPASQSPPLRFCLLTYFGSCACPELRRRDQ